MKFCTLAQLCRLNAVIDPNFEMILKILKILLAKIGLTFFLLKFLCKIWTSSNCHLHMKFCTLAQLCRLNAVIDPNFDMILKILKILFAKIILSFFLLKFLCKIWTSSSCHLHMKFCTLAQLCRLNAVIDPNFEMILKILKLLLAKIGLTFFLLKFLC